MTVRRGLEVLGLGEVELTYYGHSSAYVCKTVKNDSLTDDTGPEVPVLLDDGDELLVGLLAGTVGIDIDGQRLSNTDGVGELHKCAASKAGSDKGLGCITQSERWSNEGMYVRTNPTSGVSCGPVDLGKVLSREGSSTVGSPSTVGVDNDLATSQSSITLGSTNDEAARGLDLQGRLST